MIERLFCKTCNPVYDTLITTFYLLKDLLFLCGFLRKICYSRTISKHYKAEDDALNEEILHIILWEIPAILNLVFVLL